MKWLLLKGVLILSFSLNCFAINWTDIRGCYQTISYNDTYLENSQDNYSVINLNENPLFFISAEEEEFLVHSAVFYKGLKSYHYQDIYVDDGTTTRVDEYLRNNFRGYVRYRFSPDKILKLTNQFSVRHIEGNTYEVIAFNNIDFQGKTFLESGRFVLEKIDCYDDIATEEIFSRGIELPFELDM